MVWYQKMSVQRDEAIHSAILNDGCIVNEIFKEPFISTVNPLAV